MKDINERAVEWLLSGDTGLSSESILKHMLGRTDGQNGYPLDPDDLGRCLRLLEIFPEWKPRVGEMAQYSPGWAGQVAKWDELESLMAEEVGIDWSKGDRAEKTYKAMQLAQADGYRSDPNYECTFSKDGTLSSATKKSGGSLSIHADMTIEINSNAT